MLFRSVVNFFVDTTSISPTPSTLVLKKGPIVASSTQFSGQSYVFSVTEDKSVSVIDGIASFENLEVYQGTVVNQSFEYSSRNPFQRFVLSNTGIDLDTLRVSVRPSNQSTVSVRYNRQDNLFDQASGATITGNSPIYFINEVEGEQYELIFGDDIFGKALEDGNVINVSYIVTDGDSANGVSSFTFSGKLTYTRNSVEYNVTSGISLITANASSSGGEQIESVDSVKKYAPQKIGRAHV